MATAPLPDPAAPYVVPAETRPRERVRILGELARLDAVTPEVQAFAARVATIAAERRVSIAAALLALVQRVPYRADPANEDWYYPAATTLARGGDCDDKVRLLLAAARVLRIPGRAVWLYEPTQPQDHVSAQLWQGAVWRWAETLLPGARLGEHPHAAMRRLDLEATTMARHPLKRAPRYRTAGELPRDPNQPVWTRYASEAPRFSHYCDLERARGWVVRARALATDARVSAIAGMRNAAEQGGAVVELWAAIGNVYRALNVRPTTDPSYRALWKRWVGRASAADSNTAIARTIGPLTATQLSRSTELYRRLAAALPPEANVAGSVVAVVLPVNLDVVANAARQCVTDGDQTAACDLGPSLAVGAGWERCRYRYDAPGFLSVDDPKLSAIAPTRWLFDMARELVGELAARSVEEILTQCVVNTAALNIKAARRANMLPAELLEAATNLPADIEAMRWRDDPHRAFVAIQTIGRAFLAVPGPVGIVGAILYGIGLVLNSTPSAVGVPGDEWGRAAPVFELGFISSDGDTPVHEVPPPPDAPRSVSVLGAVSVPLLPRLTSAQPPAPSQGPTGPRSVSLLDATTNPLLGMRAGRSEPEPTAPEAQTGSGVATVVGIGLLALLARSVFR